MDKQGEALRRLRSRCYLAETGSTIWSPELQQSLQYGSSLRNAVFGGMQPFAAVGHLPQSLLTLTKFYLSTYR